MDQLGADNFFRRTTLDYPTVGEDQRSFENGHNLLDVVRDEYQPHLSLDLGQILD